MDSILISVKKLLGITQEYTHFDSDIIMHINSALFTLTQIGVGPAEGFSIKDESATWEDFVSDVKKIEAVKGYVWISVKLVFDPPANSGAMTALNERLKDYEWRLNVATDINKEE